MKRLIEFLLGWWRLKRQRCPECDGGTSWRHYAQPCRTCYGWAGRSTNKGQTPPVALVQNWRERFTAREK